MTLIEWATTSCSSRPILRPLLGDGGDCLGLALALEPDGALPQLLCPQLPSAEHLAGYRGGSEEQRDEEDVDPRERSDVRLDHHDEGVEHAEARDSATAVIVPPETPRGEEASEEREVVLDAVGT